MATTVLQYVKDLEKAAAASPKDEERALDILKRLAEVNMSLEILQETKVGKTINTLKKTFQDSAFQDLAKELINKWKELVPNSAKTTDSGMSSKAQSPGPAALARTPSADAASSGTSAAAAAAAAAKEETLPLNCRSGDSTRDSCVRVLRKELKQKRSESDLEPWEVAADIERGVFDMFKDSSCRPYKDKIRSLTAAIRNPRNPALRLGLLDGSWVATTLASATAESLLSEEERQESSQRLKELMDERQLAFRGGTKTNTLQCGKCKKYDAMFTQAQTRSADEPMTTFVCCNVCGHRWKFC